jgi:hypothetical protein
MPSCKSEKETTAEPKHCVLTQKLPNGESREITGRNFRMDAQSERVFWSMFTERVTGELVQTDEDEETDLLYFIKWANLLFSDAAVIHPIGSIEYRQAEIGQSVTPETMNHLFDLAEIRPSEAAHLTFAAIVDRAVNRTRDREAAAAPATVAGAGADKAGGSEPDAPHEIPPAPIGGQVTRAKVAKVLECTPETLRNWERAGKTPTGHSWPAGEKNGNAVFYQLSEVWPSICAMRPSKTADERTQDLAALEGMQIRKSP